MGIASSQFVLDSHAQADGSRYCKELHTDTTGRVYVVGPYKLPAGQGDAEAQVRLDARAVKLAASLAGTEFDDVLARGGSAAVLSHQTALQFADRFWSALRSAYQTDNKLVFARMVWWLYNRVQAGDFTSNQVRLSFNAAYSRSLDSAQWTSFVQNTLLPIRDRYQAILDQVDL